MTRDRRSSSEYFEIVVVSESQLHVSPNRSWNVHMENLTNGQRSASFVLVDPFDREAYEDLRWCIEDYAAIDPYARAKATRVSTSQLHYGRTLISSLAPHLATLVEPEDACMCSSGSKEVNLMIRGDGTEASLHGIRWEIIERAENHHSKLSFFISRTIWPQDGTNSSTARIREDGFINMLFVAARPGVKSDISYRSISRHVVQQLRSTSTHRIRVHFCRPGTWKKLRDMLRTPGLVYDLVHFDLHGSIAKSRGEEKAVLHFAPRSFSSKDPDRRTASAVARLLASCNVRSVVVNACNSATTKEGRASNLAYELASHGIQYVAAMSNRVKTDTATLAMRSMYASLMHNPDNLPRAVGYARSEMRRDQIRIGRYGFQVPCEDEINLVLYSALQSHGVQSISTEDLNAGPVAVNSTLTHSKASPFNRIQDLDIFSLEDALERSDIVFLAGDSGTGKTTLAKHLTDWWTITLLAKEVVYVNTADSLRSNLSTWQKNAAQSSDEPNIPDPVPNESKEHRTTSYEKIMILDNIESCGPWPQNPQAPKTLAVVKRIISDLTSMIQGVKVVVLTRLPYDELLPEFVSPFYLCISQPSLDEALSVAMPIISDDSTAINHAQAAELEDIIRDHRSNIWFAKFIMPLILKGVKDANRRFSRHLRGNNPSNHYKAHLKQVGTEVKCDLVSQFGPTSHDLIEKLLDHPTRCYALPWTYENPPQSAFGFASAYISTWPPLARAMLIPLCMFQQTMPNDICSLLQTLFDEPAVKNSFPFLLRSPTTDGWTVKDCLYRIIDTLTSFGLLIWDQLSSSSDQDLQELSSGEDRSWFHIHPLLPYFLRSESYKFCDSLQYLQHFDSFHTMARSFFWAWGEAYLRELFSELQQNTDTKLAIRTLVMVNLNIQNMFEAIRLSTSKIFKQFFSQTTHEYYALTETFNLLLWPPPRVLQWAKLLQEVFYQFEQVISTGVWCVDGQLAELAKEDFKNLNLQAAFEVHHFIALAFEVLQDMTGAAAHAQRGLDFCCSSERLFDTDSLKDLYGRKLYPLEVNRALHAWVPLQEWNVTQLNGFLSVLQSAIPDSHPDNMDCKVWRMFLALVLFSNKDRIPRDHQTLHELVEKYYATGLSFLRDGENLNMPIEYGERSMFLWAQSLFLRHVHNDESHTDSDASQLYTKHWQRVRECFSSSVPYNSALYMLHAQMYTMSMGSLNKEETYHSNEQTIWWNIYENAKQVKLVQLELFCLRNLIANARATGDLGAAEEYLKTLEELRRENLGWA